MVNGGILTTKEGQEPNKRLFMTISSEMEILKSWKNNEKYDKSATMNVKSTEALVKGGRGKRLECKINIDW